MSSVFPQLESSRLWLSWPKSKAWISRRISEPVAVGKLSQSPLVFVDFRDVPEHLVVPMEFCQFFVVKGSHDALTFRPVNLIFVHNMYILDEKLFDWASVL